MKNSIRKTDSGYGIWSKPKPFRGLARNGPKRDN